MRYIYFNCFCFTRLTVQPLNQSQGYYDKEGLQLDEDSFHQPTGLKFIEETNDIRDRALCGAENSTLRIIDKK